MLVRGLSRPFEQAYGTRPSPEQLLAERFARGEIDEEDYRRRLATLTGADRTRPSHEPASAGDDETDDSARRRPLLQLVL